MTMAHNMTVELSTHLPKFGTFNVTSLPTYVQDKWFHRKNSADHQKCHEESKRQLYIQTKIFLCFSFGQLYIRCLFAVVNRHYFKTHNKKYYLPPELLQIKIHF